MKNKLKFLIPLIIFVAIMASIYYYFNRPNNVGDAIGVLPPVVQSGRNIIARVSGSIFGNSSTNATFNTATATKVCFSGTGTCQTSPGGGSGSGTVTSVGMVVPTGFSVSGNPITTAGTSTITYSAGYSGFQPSLYPTYAYGTSTYQTLIAAGTYDPYGQATSTLASHTSTYNHANYDTAYNNASGSPFSTFTTQASSTATYQPKFTTLTVGSGGTGSTTLSGLLKGNGTSAITSIVDSSTNWNTAYTQTERWNGGSTDLVAATGRTSLGLDTAYTNASNSPYSLGFAPTVAPTFTGTTTIANITGSASSFINFLSSTVEEWFNKVKIVIMTITGQLTIPYAVSIYATSTGDIMIDTTSDQLRYKGAGATSTLVNFYTTGITYSTSTAWSGTTTIPWGAVAANQTWSNIRCFTDAGTLDTRVSTSTTNASGMNLFSASTTVNAITLSSENALLTNAKLFLVAGNPASSPTSISCRSTFGYDSN